MKYAPNSDIIPTMPTMRVTTEKMQLNVILRLLNLRLCFSSITIDDVVYVVDGGRIKVKDYNAETYLSSLAILRLLNLRLCFSSITIDDVVYVVDGGRIKVKDYSAETYLSSLAILRLLNVRLSFSV